MNLSPVYGIRQRLNIWPQKGLDLRKGVYLFNIWHQTDV